jgi:3-hydroxyisobutyrate dehydrogenase-like beta-hydroxyacid dehydrogenase
MSNLAPRFDVCVLGCGLMGSAIARAFARHGLEVAVWNRTFERAEQLSVNRIRAVRDVSEAIASTDVVVACTAAYSNLHDALDGVTTWSGQLFVNLTSGSGAEAEAFAQWATGRGLVYLDGCVASYPRAIGTKEAVLVYSGPAETWTRAEEILSLLGDSRFLPGPFERNCSVMEGLAGFYIPALSAYVDAVAYLLHQDLPSEVIEDITDVSLRLLASASRDVVHAIRVDEHETDQATVDVFADGVADTLAAFTEAGIHPFALTAAGEALDLARAAGLGELGIHAQTRLHTHPPVGRIMGP